MKNLEKKRWGNLSSQKSRLQNVINRYETEVTNPTINDITITFIIQIIYLIALIFFSWLIIQQPNLSNVVGALGLSGLGFSANWERLQESIRRFLKERRVLKTSVSALKGQLDLCGENDLPRLKNVEDQINEYYKRATET